MLNISSFFLDYFFLEYQVFNVRLLPRTSTIKKIALELNYIHLCIIYLDLFNQNRLGNEFYLNLYIEN